MEKNLENRICLREELGAISLLHQHGVHVDGLQFVGDYVDIVISERYLNSQVLNHLSGIYKFRLQSFALDDYPCFRLRIDKES